MSNSEHNDFPHEKKLLKRNQKIAKGFLLEYWDGNLLKKEIIFCTPR